MKTAKEWVASLPLQEDGVIITDVHTLEKLILDAQREMMAECEKRFHKVIAAIWSNEHELPARKCECQTHKVGQNPYCPIHGLSNQMGRQCITL